MQSFFAVSFFFSFLQLVVAMSRIDWAATLLWAGRYSRMYEQYFDPPMQEERRYTRFRTRFRMHDIPRRMVLHHTYSTLENDCGGPGLSAQHAQLQLQWLVSCWISKFTDAEEDDQTDTIASAQQQHQEQQTFSKTKNSQHALPGCITTRTLFGDGDGDGDGSDQPDGGVSVAPSSPPPLSPPLPPPLQEKESGHDDGTCNASAGAGPRDNSHETVVPLDIYFHPPPTALLPRSHQIAHQCLMNMLHECSSSCNDHTVTWNAENKDTIGSPMTTRGGMREAEAVVAEELVTHFGEPRPLSPTRSTPDQRARFHSGRLGTSDASATTTTTTTSRTGTLRSNVSNQSCIDRDGGRTSNVVDGPRCRVPAAPGDFRSSAPSRQTTETTTSTAAPTTRATSFPATTLHSIEEWMERQCNWIVPPPSSPSMWGATVPSISHPSGGGGGGAGEDVLDRSSPPSESRDTSDRVTSEAIQEEEEASQEISTSSRWSGVCCAPLCASDMETAERQTQSYVPPHIRRRREQAMRRHLRAQQLLVGQADDVEEEEKEDEDEEEDEEEDDTVCGGTRGRFLNPVVTGRSTSQCAKHGNYENDPLRNHANYGRGVSPDRRQQQQQPAHMLGGKSKHHHHRDIIVVSDPHDSMENDHGGNTNNPSLSLPTRQQNTVLLGPNTTSAPISAPVAAAASESASPDPCWAIRQHNVKDDDHVPTGTWHDSVAPTPKFHIGNGNCNGTRGNAHASSTTDNSTFVSPERAAMIHTLKQFWDSDDFHIRSVARQGFRSGQQWHPMTTIHTQLGSGTTAPLEYSWPQTAAAAMNDGSGERWPAMGASATCSEVLLPAATHWRRQGHSHDTAQSLVEHSGGSPPITRDTSMSVASPSMMSIPPLSCQNRVQAQSVVSLRSLPLTHASSKEHQRIEWDTDTGNTSVSESIVGSKKYRGRPRQCMHPARELESSSDMNDDIFDKYWLTQQHSMEWNAAAKDQMMMQLASEYAHWKEWHATSKWSRQPPVTIYYSSVAPPTTEQPRPVRQLTLSYPPRRAMATATPAHPSHRGVLEFMRQSSKNGHVSDGCDGTVTTGDRVASGPRLRDEQQFTVSATTTDGRTAGKVSFVSSSPLSSSSPPPPPPLPPRWNELLWTEDAPRGHCCAAAVPQSRGKFPFEEIREYDTTNMDTRIGNIGRRVDTDGDSNHNQRQGTHWPTTLIRRTSVTRAVYEWALQHLFKKNLRAKIARAMFESVTQPTSATPPPPPSYCKSEQEGDDEIDTTTHGRHGRRRHHKPAVPTVDLSRLPGAATMGGAQTEEGRGMGGQRDAQFVAPMEKHLADGGQQQQQYAQSGPNKLEGKYPEVATATDEHDCSRCFSNKRFMDQLVDSLTIVDRLVAQWARDTVPLTRIPRGTGNTGVTIVTDGTGPSTHTTTTSARSTRGHVRHRVASTATTTNSYDPERERRTDSLVIPPHFTGMSATGCRAHGSTESIHKFVRAHRRSHDGGAAPSATFTRIEDAMFTTLIESSCERFDNAEGFQFVTVDFPRDDVQDPGGQQIEH